VYRSELGWIVESDATENTPADRRRKKKVLPVASAFDEALEVAGQSRRVKHKTVIQFVASPYSEQAICYWCMEDASLSIMLSSQLLEKVLPDEFLGFLR
jgi:hypothetical protein